MLPLRRQNHRFQTSFQIADRKRGSGSAVYASLFRGEITILQLASIAGSVDPEGEVKSGAPFFESCLDDIDTKETTDKQ